MLLPCPCIEPRRSSAQRLSNEVRSHRRKREGTGSYSTLRWLLYAVFCYYSSLALFWLYAVLALRCLLSPFSLPTPRTSTESPPNLYLPNLHSISAVSLPNLCRIYTLNVLHASILSLCAALWAAGLAVQRVPLFATVVCLACLAT